MFILLPIQEEKELSHGAAPQKGPGAPCETISVCCQSRVAGQGRAVCYSIPFKHSSTSPGPSLTGNKLPFSYSMLQVAFLVWGNVHQNMSTLLEYGATHVVMLLLYTFGGCVLWRNSHPPNQRGKEAAGRLCSLLTVSSKCHTAEQKHSPQKTVAPLTYMQTNRISSRKEEISVAKQNRLDM